MLTVTTPVVFQVGEFLNEAQIPKPILEVGGGWFRGNGAEVYVCRGAHMLKTPDSDGRDCRYGWQVKEIRGTQTIVKPAVKALTDEEKQQLRAFRMATELAFVLNSCGDAEAPELTRQVDHVLAVAKLAFTRLGLQTKESAFKLLDAVDCADSAVPCFDLKEERDLGREELVKEWETLAHLLGKTLGALPSAIGGCKKCGSSDSLRYYRTGIMWYHSDVTKDGFAQLECCECGHVHGDE